MRRSTDEALKIEDVVPDLDVRVAADRKTDLIVIGNRERHGLAFLIKPTEDVVVHRAPCDVLAVRLADRDVKAKKK